MRETGKVRQKNRKRGIKIGENEEKIVALESFFFYKDAISLFI